MANKRCHNNITIVVVGSDTTTTAAMLVTVATIDSGFTAATVGSGATIVSYDQGKPTVVRLLHISSRTCDHRRLSQSTTLSLCTQPLATIRLAIAGGHHSQQYYC